MKVISFNINGLRAAVSSQIKHSKFAIIRFKNAGEVNFSKLREKVKFNYKIAAISGMAE